MIIVWVVLGTCHAKIVWKTKPQEFQMVKENEKVQLNCEFKEEQSKDDTDLTKNLANNFVIWYKDGHSQNILALNDRLANLNSNYEINGTYNLVIKNLTRNDSGLYTCQLFQSKNMLATVNLTVLGKQIFCIHIILVLFSIFNACISDPNLNSNQKIS